MKLRSATIEGFRGFTKKVFVDLDANVILLQGPNGVGKTSLLDAILWAPRAVSTVLERKVALFPSMRERELRASS